MVAFYMLLGDLQILHCTNASFSDLAAIGGCYSIASWQLSSQTSEVTPWHPWQDMPLKEWAEFLYGYGWLISTGFCTGASVYVSTENYASFVWVPSLYVGTDIDRKFLHTRHSIWSELQSACFLQSLRLVGFILQYLPKGRCNCPCRRMLSSF